VGSRALSEGPEPATDSKSRVSVERGSIDSQSEEDMEHDLPSDRRWRGLRARGRDGLWIGLYGLRLRRRIRMRNDLFAKLGPIPPGSLRAHLFAQEIEVALVFDPRRPPPLPRHRR
jgi:hypothetical protein